MLGSKQISTLEFWLKTMSDRFPREIVLLHRILESSPRLAQLGGSPSTLLYPVSLLAGG